MAIEDWDKHPGGTLALSQLMAWEAAAHPVAGVLRLETALTPDQLVSGQLSVLQLALNKAQLHDLGGALLKLSEQIED